MSLEVKVKTVMKEFDEWFDPLPIPLEHGKEIERGCEIRDNLYGILEEAQKLDEAWFLKYNALKEQLENQLKGAQKKADYFEAHYNVNYETWLNQTKQIVNANQTLDELQKDNFRGLPTRVQDHINQLREVLK